MTEQEWLTCDNLVRMLRVLAGREIASGAVTEVTTSERKMRLFACACCRQVWHYLKHKRSREAVEVAELYADGQATRKELRRAFDSAADASNGINQPTSRAALWAADRAALWAADTRQQSWLVDLDATLVWLLKPGGPPALLRDVVGNPFQAAPKLVLPSSAERTQVITLAQVTYEERLGKQRGCMNCQGPLKERVDELMRGGPLGDGIGPRNTALRITHEFNTHLSPEEVHRIWQNGQSWFTGHCECWEEDCAFDPVSVTALRDALIDAGCCSEELLAHLASPGPHIRGCWAIDTILGKE